jgi:hypothetical protein
MRKALNENPTVQIVVIGMMLVLGLVVATGALTGSGGSTSKPASGAAATGSGAAGSTYAPSTASSAVPTSSSVAGVRVPTDLLPPTRADLVAAYERGDAIVLLVVRGGGIEDAMVRSSVRRLEGERGVAVYVTRAEHIARYASITEGVNVNRVPALVVVKSRRLSGGEPKATVRYGFRSAQSVVQAVHDALHRGGTATYYPR